MKRANVATLLLTAVSAMAQAQSTSDDMRCLLVAHGFASLAKTAPEKRVARLSEAFYLGRIDARVPPAAIAGLIRVQGRGLSGPQATKVMTACAFRAEQASRRLQAAARQSAGSR